MYCLSTFKTYSVPAQIGWQYLCTPSPALCPHNSRYISDVISECSVTVHLLNRVLLEFFSAPVSDILVDMFWGNVLFVKAAVLLTFTTQIIKNNMY